MTVSIDRAGDIAVITVDNPPVNALGQALRQGLWDAVEMLDLDPAVRAVVLTCAGRTFIAGADVAEFGKPPVPPHLPDLVDRVERAAKPWVAAIHGSALGGGFELAMGCRFRVALDSAAVGLPEVALGIIPGASGTVRTPRLAGVEVAVDLVTSGRPVRAAEALSMGLLDHVVTGDLRSEAVAFAREALTRPLPPPISARPITSPDALWWKRQREIIVGRAKGEVAPLRALDCLRMAAEAPFAEAVAHERATFLTLRASDQAAALRHVFFAERAAYRPAHLAGVNPRRIGKVAVIGRTATGEGIFAALRDAGVPTVLLERDALFSDTLGSPLDDADLAIECVSGDLEVRRAVLARLDQVCSAHAVLATTGANLDPRPVFTGMPQPDRLIGLHVFDGERPVQLLEIVPTPLTSKETVSTLFALARLVNRIPVQAGRCDSFIRNRLLMSCRREAEVLVREGTPIDAIDAAARASGLEIGPFETQDSVGAEPRHQTTAAGQGRLPADRGTNGRVPTADEIFTRLSRAMATEGKAMLADGTALQASDIDLVAIHLCGFPRWRGGPMFASDRQ